MPPALLLLQVVAILATARSCGLILRRLGQPAVIGEMAAGFLLGPVGLGTLLPDVHARLFPMGSLAGLSALSTIGLVLFMFVVGLQLREGNLAEQAKAAGAVGLLSMLFPIAFGLALSPLLHKAYAPAASSFWPFAIFIAAALAVTALPVMARILSERRLLSTPVGQLAISSAVLVDVGAWVLIAVVLSLAGPHGQYGAAKSLGGLAILLGLAFLLLRPLYAWISRDGRGNGLPAGTQLGSWLVGLLGCAAISELLNLHVVLGALLFGMCMPRDEGLSKYWAHRLEPLTNALFMPIFFAMAGLSASPAVFTGPGIAMLALVLCAAIAGKGLGGTVGARLAGCNWRDSLAIGSLMNARGLMELVVIKIGLDMEIIGPDLFTLLLLMTLITTAMTGPLMALLTSRHSGQESLRPSAEPDFSAAPCLSAGRQPQRNGAPPRS